MNLLLRQFAHTVRAFASRPRSYLGFAAFLFFDLVMLGMLQADHLRAAARAYYLKSRSVPLAGSFAGLTIAYFMLVNGVAWLGALFPTLAAGDSVAKEVEDGTLRTALCRPVPRWRLLLIRWMNGAAFVVALAAFVTGAALLCGIIDSPAGNLVVILADDRPPLLHHSAEALRRFAWAVPFLALTLLTMMSLAFLFSCCALRPLVATVTALALLYCDRFFYEVPFFKVFRPWFLSTRLDAWTLLFTQQEIPWSRLRSDALILAALSLSFAVAGGVVFARRDLKP